MLTWLSPYLCATRFQAEYRSFLAERRPGVVRWLGGLKWPSKLHCVDVNLIIYPEVINFSATRLRTGCSCSAIQTVPIPPWPIFCSNLNHQHIAKVLDAGTVADGTPYFVMELVQGDPITDLL